MMPRTTAQEARTVMLLTIPILAAPGPLSDTGEGE